jgi:hypothetical protein
MSVTERKEGRREGPSGDGNEPSFMSFYVICKNFFKEERKIEERMKKKRI